MAINKNFVFTDPVAGQQHIALAQLAASEKEANNRNIAALLESQSRERQQRGLTQSQMAQRDREFKTDAEIRREQIGVNREHLQLRRDVDLANQKLDKDATRDAAAKERAKIQFSSVIQALQDSIDDPPTTSELEALLTNAPDLTEDQRQAARTVRLGHVKNAKANAAMGQQAAKNYTAELGNKALLESDKAKVYERMAKDPNVIFDLASGRVESAFRPPREDAPSGARAGGPPTIEDMRARIGKRSTRGLLATPPTVSMLAAPAPAAAAPAPFQFAPNPEASSFFPLETQQRMASLLEQDAQGRGVRAADIAVPPPMQFAPPPPMAAPSGFTARPPQVSTMDRLLQMLPQMPEFAQLPAEGQQMVLDQITGGAMQMPAMPAPPRMSDLRALRPEFIPQDPGFYVAPQ